MPRLEPRNPDLLVLGGHWYSKINKSMSRRFSLARKFNLFLLQIRHNPEALASSELARNADSQVLPQNY